MFVIIIIVICLVVITVIAFLALSSWGLSSFTGDLTKWAKGLEKERAKKDAKSMIQLGYILDQKWYDKTSKILANNADDLEAKSLWGKLAELKNQVQKEEGGEAANR